MSLKPSDLVNSAIRTSQTYAEMVPHVKSLIKSGDFNTCKQVITQIKKIIKDKKPTPVQKFLALELLQECMMLKNINFLNFAQTKILDRLVILAQKTPNDLFRDSNKSIENKQASEQFITNLLSYIQLWAQNFGRDSNSEPSLYMINYNRLQGKVSFPILKSSTLPPKQRNSVPARQETTRRTLNKQKSDLESIQYLENLLVIIEEIENPYIDETGKELINNMTQLKPDLENIISAAVAKEDAEEIEKLFSLSERVQKIEEKKNKTKEFSNKPYRKDPPIIINYKDQPKNFQNYREQHPEKEEFKTEPLKIKEESVNRKNTPPDQNIFANILDLDFSQNESYSAQYKTCDAGKIPSFPSPDMKSIPNNFENPGFNVIQPSFLLTPDKNLELSNLQNELCILRQNILEKDEMLSELNKTVYELKLKNDQLEHSLIATKQILEAKEKECEEFHCLKQKNGNSDIFEGLLNQKIKKTQEILEEKADNDNIFKFACVESVAVLFDNDILQIGFKVVYEQDTLMLSLYIGNKSDKNIKKIILTLEKSSGLESSISKSNFLSIGPMCQDTFEI